MARKRKPCDFCDGEYESAFVDGRNGFCLWLEVYPFNHIMTFWGQGNDENEYMQEDSIDVEMNYCPVCGRKLTDI